MGTGVGKSPFDFVRVQRHAIRFVGHAARGGRSGQQRRGLAVVVLRGRRRRVIVGNRLVLVGSQ